MITQKIRNGENVIFNKEDKPMYANRAGEVAFIHEYQQVKAKFSTMHRPNQCYEELPILIQDFVGNYSVQKFTEPTSHRIKVTCTRRICTELYMPGFNVGSDINEQRIFVQSNGQISSRAPLTKVHPIEYHCSLTQSKYKVIFTEKQLKETR